MVLWQSYVQNETIWKADDTLLTMQLVKKKKNQKYVPGIVNCE